MKLLDKKDINEGISKERMNSFVNRARLISKIRKDEQSLSQVEVETYQKKERLRKEYLDFFHQTNDRKSELMNEVDELEKRKEKALEPLDDYRIEIEIRNQEVFEKEQELKKEITRIEDLCQKVDEKEKLLNDFENNLTLREEKIKENEIDNERKSKELSDEIKNLNKKLAIFERRTKERETELNTKDYELITREKEVEIKIKQLEKENETLNKERKHLESQQKSLQSAFAELKKHDK